METRRINFLFLLFCCSTAAHTGKNNFEQLSSHEVSNVFAEKLISQFSRGHEMKISEFEKLLVLLQIANVRTNTTSTCVNGLEMLKQIESSSKNVSGNFLVDAEHFISACPILLYNVASGESFMDENICPESESTKKESRGKVWFYATLAIIAISLCGLFGVIVIPIVDKNYYFYVLQYFMAVAVGTLTGDALLHLLPHSMRASSDEMDRSELLQMMTHRGIAAMLGILSFCFIEKLLKYITSLKANDEKIVEINEIESLQRHGHSHGAIDPNSSSLSSIVWMVILGDGLHNFTDGMAIGAAFSNNIAGGFSTTVAVFCHELPHEMGDFAVLLKAGMSARQAIFYNILSSILSFFGMCVGISIGDTPETTQWVFAVAAGLFIYIALVDMVSRRFTRQTAKRLTV